MPRLSRIEAEVLRLGKEVERIRPISGIGIYVADSPTGNGRSISLGNANEASGASLHPLKVIDASDEADFMVRVVKGRVNAMADADGPFSAGDDPVFTLVVDDGDEVYVDITCAYDAMAGWSETAFTVAKAASTPSASATHAFYPIKDVSITDDVMTLGGGVNGNIGHRRCGDGTTYTDAWWAGP